MGYSVNKMAGEPIIIKEEGCDKLAELFDRVEAETGIGHISWCYPLHVIRPQYGDSRSLVERVLTDYGFIVECGEDDIAILSWGGDKIGSSWDPMWNAIGEVVTETAKWLIIGEDNEFWIEYCEPGKGRRQLLVDTDQLLNSAVVGI